VGDFSIEPAGAGRLQASGELTFDTAARALDQGARLIAGGSSWIVDLGQVRSGDSAGLAVLLEWLASAQRSGTSLDYENIPPQMLAIARISEIDKMLTAG
jgi:phospholipid transport system transporter-binding protein